MRYTYNYIYIYGRGVDNTSINMKLHTFYGPVQCAEMKCSFYSSLLYVLLCLYEMIVHIAKRIVFIICVLLNRFFSCCYCSWCRLLFFVLLCLSSSVQLQLARYVITSFCLLIFTNPSEYIYIYAFSDKRNGHWTYTQLLHFSRTKRNQQRCKTDRTTNIANIN